MIIDLKRFFTPEFLAMLEPLSGNVSEDLILCFTLFFGVLLFTTFFFIFISYLIECLTFGLNYKYGYWKRNSFVDKVVDFVFECFRMWIIVFNLISCCNFTFRVDPLNAGCSLMTLVLFFYVMFLSKPWNDWYKEYEDFVEDWKKLKNEFKNIRLRRTHK